MQNDILLHVQINMMNMNAKTNDDTLPSPDNPSDSDQIDSTPEPYNAVCPVRKTSGDIRT